MKRTIISCILAVGVWLTATATNTVTLTSVQGHPGDEVEVAVALTGESAVTAIELLVPLGDMLRYVDGSAVLSTERADGHTLTAAGQDGKLSMVIFSPTLAPLKGVDGELCRFKVKLGKEPADYTLNPEVVMSDASGNALTCSVESGVVTLLSPKIEVTTPIIDYDCVPIRSEYTHTLSVYNRGNEPLEITGIAFDNSDLTASPTTSTIAAGSTQDFTLTYAPRQRGTLTSNVTITTNAVNPKAGKAVVKAQPFSVNELHVQHAEGISDEEVTVVLKMNNMEPIAGAQCEFTLPEALLYVEGSAAAGNRCSGTDHKATGVVQGDKLTLLLYSVSNAMLPEGDGELMTFRVRLDGQSGWYELNPQEVVLSNVTMENMTSATSGEYVVIQSPSFSGNSTLEFGDTPVTQKTTATYAIYNSGEVNLTINKVTFLAEGYAVEQSLPLTIAPRESKKLTVVYTPTAEGEHKTTMQVYTNDPVNRMKSVALSGRVYEPNHIIVSGDNTREGYQFAFALDNYTDIVAIQMNVKWLSGMKTSMDKLKITERLKGHSYLVTDIGEGNYQILVYSMANAPITGTNGTLFTLDYIAEEGVTYQDTELRVMDIVLSDAKGNNYVSDGEVVAAATFTSFTLRFVVEGETVGEQFVRAGAAVVAPEVEERVGHSFVWTGLPQTMPGNDVTVTGNYTTNSYTVTYMVDGEVYKTESYAYGAAITAAEASTKEGHTFSGWSEVPETMPAENITITGSFTVNNYTITYIVDGEVYKTESIAYGSKVEAIVAPTKEGWTFSGWNGVPATMPAKDITVSGSFTVNFYTVTYMVDGELYKTESYAYGAAITAAEAPTKEGYAFSGWSEIPATMPAKDVTVNGAFSINTYIATFMVDGEEYCRVNVVYGEEIILVDTLTKEGHTFSGWGEVPTTMPAKDITINGNFSINSYTVTYVVDGEVYKTESITYGSKLTPIAVPVKEGHTFSGWGGVPNTMPAKDVTINGTFTINTYAITYMVDGEVYQTMIVTYGEAITLIDNPSKEGYTFSGWLDAPETMPAKDVTINGRFVTNGYTVTYLLDGEVYKTFQVEYGSKIPIVEEPAKEGYTFGGWSEVPSTMPAKDITVSGSFTVNSYIVTYMVDGELYKTESYAYGSAITAAEAFTKEGYTFSGWSEIPATMPAKDVTVTGYFTTNKYLVTFKIDDEVIVADSLEYGAAIVVPEAPDREGYTFDGWGEVAETVPAGDVTYEGSYTINSYQFTYVVDGETVKSDSVVYGTAIVALEEPTKEGHTFSGWSEVPETMPAKDVTVTGYFTINKYLVTFKVDDEVIAADSLEYGDEIVAPNAPDREGYAFDGWGEVAETVPASDVTYEGSYTVNIYKVYYYVDEELVHTAEVAYGEPIPEYVYEPTEEGYTFLGWIGDTYETMPAHDVTYTANIDNGIEQLTIDKSQLTIYDLTGRKVTDTENLKGGIYIMNGKKVVIK